MKAITLAHRKMQLSPAQIAWCIERGIFKRDMLADKVAS